MKLAKSSNKNKGTPVTSLLGVSKDAYTSSVFPFDEKTDIRSNAFDAEDEFTGMYLGQGDSVGLIQPPYNMKTLDRLSQENNSLSPCIEAMVTNIDGTGFRFEDDNLTDRDTLSADKGIDELTKWFSETWPGESFVTQRKNMRRDLHRTGNAYLEVIRNLNGVITFLRVVDAKMVRLATLGEPVTVEKVLMRGGEELTVRMSVRERRYAQLLEGKSVVYFREFGSGRHLDKRTGVWYDVGAESPLDSRATELLHFTDLPDAHTSYGVPRWVSQLPSILGSREAEEFNLEFFRNGGVPPVLLMLQGSTLSHDTRKALEQKTSGLASRNNRVQVIETETSGGTLDKPGQSRITVERFGGERQTDSFFEEYDNKCELRVRRSFRLPPIFVGSSGDYTYATAYTSYTVGEAQVFKPERDEFDEIINTTIIPELGYRGFFMRSNPLVIKDQVTQLKGVDIVSKLGAVEPEGLVEAVNEAAGTHMRVSEDAASVAERNELETTHVSSTDIPSGTPAKSDVSPPKVVKSGEVVELAMEVSRAVSSRDKDALSNSLGRVSKLDENSSSEFNRSLAALKFTGHEVESDYLGELAGCTAAIIAANSR